MVQPSTDEAFTAFDQVALSNCKGPKFRIVDRFAVMNTALTRTILEAFFPVDSVDKVTVLGGFVAVRQFLRTASDVTDVCSLV